MILYWQALIQGIVQGITEFLPVSSTGHMILVNETFLKMDKAFSEMFEVVIQLGSILSVLVHFRRRIFSRALFTFDFRSPEWRLWFKVLPAVVPALIVGGIFGGVIQEHLYNPVTVATALLLGGIALIFIESPKLAPKTPRCCDLENLSYAKAVGIGFVQCIAMIPGVSRSAATIVGGMGFGCSRALAAEFSFFLAIPTMAAASGYSLLKHGTSLDRVQWIALGIGFATAFLVAWGVIAFFMSFIRKHDFRAFGYYRIALGIAVLAFFFCGGWKN